MRQSMALLLFQGCKCQGDRKTTAFAWVIGG